MFRWLISFIGGATPKCLGGGAKLLPRPTFYKHNIGIGDKQKSRHESYINITTMNDTVLLGLHLCNTMCKPVLLYASECMCNSRSDEVHVTKAWN